MFYLPPCFAASHLMTQTSSFEMQLTDKILQHVGAMTNLNGRCSIPDWRDVDIEELQAYVGLLTLASIYRSKDESILSLWSEKSGALSGLGCLTRGFTTSAEHWGSMTRYPDPDVMLTRWLPSTEFGICGHTVWPMQALLHLNWTLTPRYIHPLRKDNDSSMHVVILFS